jgi:hypothetical protein
MGLGRNEGKMGVSMSENTGLKIMVGCLLVVVFILMFNLLGIE